MTDATDRDRHPDLSDDRLDALLAAADSELLSYLQAQTKPTALWGALLTPRHDHTRSGHRLEEPSAQSCDLHALRHLEHRIQAYQVVHVLVRDVDFVRDADRALGRALGHVRVRDSGRALGRVLVRDVDRARARAHVLDRDLDDVRVRDLIRDLDRALDLVRRLDHALRHAHIRGLVRRVGYVLDLALDRARALDRAFVTGRLSVAGMDMSGLDIEVADGPALAGVCWDDATTWPAEVAGMIRAQSVELAPGEYQVRNRMERDPADGGVSLL